MAKQIRVRSIKRREVDEHQLALAFLLLAKILHEQAQSEAESEPSDSPGKSEAA